MSSSPVQSGQPLPDLSACEREPIHIPGAVEPHGVLLVISEPEMHVLQTSANTLEVVGIAPERLLGMVLRDVLTQQDVQRVAAAMLDEGKRRYVGGVRLKNRDTLFDALVHRHLGMLIVELEPASSGAAALAESEIYVSLTDAMVELDGPMPLPELCRRIAARIRHITGFDRVMVYRFLEDDSGSVIAEDRREDLTPFLGLRYPASDIPAQARRLYLLNTLRLKPDVNAQRAPLMPAVNPSTGSPLDMTFCVLRAMSPVHDEYLRNMGVVASMSISVVKDQRLWGLIACHHGQPRFVPHSMRITCEVLARVFSSRIAAAEEEGERAHVDAGRALADRIRARLLDGHDAAGTLGEEGEHIMSAMRAQGAVFCIRDKLSCFGVTPGREQLDGLLEWLSANQHEHFFTTERLAAHYSDAGQFSDRASGLASIRIALGGPDFILCFRPAVVQVIHWGGNPAKPVEETEAGKRISPRRSFELWKQTYSDSSEPWDETAREFARGLRHIVAEALLLQMNEEVQRLNLELARSNVELDSFAHAASHDLQEPVRMIRSYAQLLARRAGPDLAPESRDFVTLIENSAGRMSHLIAALLSYSQVGGSERRQHKPVKLEDVLRWVLINLDEAVRESQATVTHDSLPVVMADSDLMVQLLQNLIGNAIKYRRQDDAPRVHVSAAFERDHWLFSVRDNGQGFKPEHSDLIFAAFKRLHGRDVPGSGIGLATCKRIVELHGGRIWAESEGRDRGATFWFTMPDRSGVNEDAGH